MIQTVFLDTNIILDYIENRNVEVRDFVALLLHFHGKGKIALATSIFNIVELIDKEFDICFTKKLLSDNLSSDEVLSKRKRNTKMFREISKSNRKIIEEKIRNFIIRKRILVLSPPFSQGSLEYETSEYEEIYRLIYEYQLSSQDALIIATALIHKVTYFFSKDSDLIRQIDENKLIDAYDLGNSKHLENFTNSVLDSLTGVLK